MGPCEGVTIDWFVGLATPWCCNISGTFRCVMVGLLVVKGFPWLDILFWLVWFKRVYLVGGGVIPRCDYDGPKEFVNDARFPRSGGPLGSYGVALKTEPMVELLNVRRVNVLGDISRTVFASRFWVLTNGWF